MAHATPASEELYMHLSTHTALVATAKQRGVPFILSDDMDLATFAASTLDTANPKTIDAARIAGKLK